MAKQGETDEPTSVLVNLPTGEAELLRACAGDAPTMRLIPFRAPDEISNELPDAAVLLISSAQYDATLARTLARHGRRLQWIHSPNTGVETFVRHGVPKGVRLSHMPGRNADQVAEHAMALLLGLAHALPLLERHRARASWQRDEVVASMSSLRGRQLCIVGFGAIGQALARRARAFEMRVTAVARTARQMPAGESCVAPSQLDDRLPDADVVVLALPLSASTSRLFDRRRLFSMKPSAVFVNVSRGEIVDTVALVDALRDGALAGAGLDVFDEEPLPPSHPLWRLPNVLLSPHVAGVGGPRELVERAGQLRRVLLDGINGITLAPPVQWVPSEGLATPRFAKASEQCH